MSFFAPMENNDEIDLLELFRKIIQWINSNLLKLSISVLIGGVLGYSYSIFATKIYESRMLVSSEILTETFCLRVFGELNESIKEDEVEEVAEKLGISTAEAASIKSIRVESSLKEKVTNQEKNFFLIAIRITDQSILPKLQSYIVKFMLNNSFIKTKSEERKKLMAQIQIELESLAELKSRVYKGDLFEKAKGNVMFDPTEINTKTIQLNEQVTKLERELAGDGIQLVQNFSKSSKPVWPRTLISIGLGISLSLFILMLLIFGQFAMRLAKDNQMSDSR